jgi:hypothetical protein
MPIARPPSFLVNVATESQFCVTIGTNGSSSIVVNGTILAHRHSQPNIPAIERTRQGTVGDFVFLVFLVRSYFGASGCQKRWIVSSIVVGVVV